MKTQPTALLVEDDGAIREALTELLETSGYRVNAFATAEQGIASLRAESVSLLVTDYVLPGESGGWLVRQSRAEGLLQATLVVMVTALLQPPEARGRPSPPQTPGPRTAPPRGELAVAW
ncbi:response regulator [Archangium gephyra]|uniref:response regulator n=1 Tax=Archangium gephyra TaxID=48 RepID=UPI003B7FB373